MVSMVRASSEIHSHTRFRGVARIFKGGGRFFIDKGKAGSARCLRTFMRLFGTGVPGSFRGEALVVSGVKPRKTFHFLAFESPRLREN